jgi:hypothetical protein
VFAIIHGSRLLIPQVKAAFLRCIFNLLVSVGIAIDSAAIADGIRRDSNLSRAGKVRGMKPQRAPDS